MSSQHRLITKTRPSLFLFVALFVASRPTGGACDRVWPGRGDQRRLCGDPVLYIVVMAIARGRRVVWKGRSYRAG